MVVLGIDCWNGNQDQVQIYKDGTNPTTTYPLLLNGSSVESSYDVSYDWSLVIDQNGVVQYSDGNADINAINSKIDQLLISDIEPSTEIAGTFELFQNFPNPFNPETFIQYYLPVANFIDLSVYNMLGQKVQTIVEKRQEAGNHSIVFNADGLASGPYFYKLVSGSEVTIRRMTLVR